MSHPQASSQAKPAFLKAIFPSGPSPLAGKGSFHHSLLGFGKRFLEAEAGAGFLPGLLGSAFMLTPVTHFLKEAGENCPDLEEVLLFSL